MAFSKQIASAIDAEEMKPDLPVKKEFFSQIEDLWSTRETINKEREDWRIKEGLLNQELREKDERLKRAAELCQEKTDDYLKTHEQLMLSKKEVVKLRTETEQMRENHLKLLQAEKDMDRAKWEEYDETLAASRTEMQAQQEECLKLEKQLQSEREQSKCVGKTLEDNINNREAQIEIQKAAIGDSEQQITAWKELNNSQGERIEERDKQIIALLKDHENEVSSHLADIERRDERIRNSANDFNKKLATHKTDIAEWVEKVRNLNSAIKDNERKVSELKDVIITQDQQIASQRTEVEVGVRKVRELGCVVENQDKQIASQRNNLDDCQRNIRKLEDLIGTGEKTIISLQSALDTRDERIKELEAPRKKLEAEIDSQQNIIEDQKRSIVQLGVHLLQKESSLHNAKAVITAVQLAVRLPSTNSSPRESERCSPEIRGQEINTITSWSQPSSSSDIAGTASTIIYPEQEESSNEWISSMESMLVKDSVSPSPSSPLLQHPRSTRSDKRRRSASIERNGAEEVLGIGKRRKTPTPKKLQSNIEKCISTGRTSNK